MSLIDEFGALYIASRLERLSETLKKDAVHIFRTHLEGIKYKWYPVLYTLHIKERISVVELATELSYAHPTIIDVLKEMENENLIKSEKDDQDSRRRMLVLSSKGKKLVEKILPLTKAFSATVKGLIDNEHHLLKAIEAVEQKLEDESFFKKVNKALKPATAPQKQKKLSAKLQ